MNAEDLDIYKIIASVMNGNPTVEEKAAFDRWINENTDNQKFYKLINNVSDKDSFTDDDLIKVYTKVKDKIRKTNPFKRYMIWAASAAASILILVSLIFIYLNSQHQSKNIVYLEASTPAGVHSKFTLSDGTIVYLNAGSTLRYPDKFIGNHRTVSLVGEAYFEVFSDKKHPFIVETKGINIKVLGTRFNVRAYEGEKIIETSLLEGSVALYKITDLKQKNASLLKPNQSAYYSVESGKLTVKKINASLKNIWKDGKFFFEYDNMNSIAKELERRFNVNIRIVDKELNNQVFYGLFTDKKNVYQLLDLMKINNHFNYYQNGDTIYIHKDN